MDISFIEIIVTAFLIPFILIVLMWLILSIDYFVAFISNLGTFAQLGLFLTALYLVWVWSKTKRKRWIGEREDIKEITKKTFIMKDALYKARPHNHFMPPILDDLDLKKMGIGKKWDELNDGEKNYYCSIYNTYAKTQNVDTVANELKIDLGYIKIIRGTEDITHWLTYILILWRIFHEYKAYEYFRSRCATLPFPLEMTIPFWKIPESGGPRTIYLKHYLGKYPSEQEREKSIGFDDYERIRKWITYSDKKFLQDPNDDDNRFDAEIEYAYEEFSKAVKHFIENVK